MLLEFVPQHCDDVEAASARFPGDPPDPRAAGAPARFGASGWVCTGLVVLLAAIVLSARGRGTALVWHALVQADRIDHPVFVIGVLLTAVGGAMVVVPLVYVLGVRRSARPVIDQRVRVHLGEDAVTVRLPHKELSLSWQGAVAVAETRNLFVLKTLGDLRLSLPKRGVPGFADSPDAAVRALRDRLQSKIPPLAAVVAPAPRRLAA